MSRSRAIRNATLSFLLGTIAILLAVVGVGAQEVPALEITRTDLSEFPVVRLQIAASGEAAATGLGAEDLAVTENGDPVTITEVVPLAQESLDVVLTLDVSGSMEGDALAQAKVAAIQFVDQLPGTARVAVLAFGSDTELVSNFTTDRDASRDAINGLDLAGETALNDAIVSSVELVNASDASRTAVVLLTDGADTASTATEDDAVGALDGTTTDFYAVSLETDETDTAALEAFADVSRGSVIEASDPDALSAAYVGVGQRIANQYEIAFESVTEDATGTFAVTVPATGDTTSIEVALPGRAGGGGVVGEEFDPSTVEPLVTDGSVSGVQQPWVLWLGAALVAVALGITAYVVLPSTEERARRRSLSSDRETVYETSSGERIVTTVRDAATRFTSRAVERSERGALIDSALDRAGLVMRSGEFVAFVLAAAIGAGFLLFLLMGAVGLLIGVLTPILGAPAFLRFLAARRNRKFADQLSDTLLLMAGSLRSGFGVGQAIDQVAQEMDDPIATEFGRAILETRLGRDVEDALSSIAVRVQNEDFEWVVDAMRIHRQVGGDLAQILDKVSETIRARNRLKRQISALTAEGRMSALVLGILPVAMTLLLYSSNPDYLDPLFSETAGRLMLGVGLGLLAAGAFWLKKLIDVEL